LIYRSMESEGRTKELRIEGKKLKKKKKNKIIKNLGPLPGFPSVQIFFQLEEALNELESFGREICLLKTEEANL